MKLSSTITQSFFVWVIQVPTFSPIGVIAISTPSVKNIIPAIRSTAPSRNARRIPGSSGAIVKHRASTIAMIGSTAFNVSFSFSSNFSFNFAILKFTHSLPFLINCLSKLLFHHRLFFQHADKLFLRNNGDSQLPCLPVFRRRRIHVIIDEIICLRCHASCHFASSLLNFFFYLKLTAEELERMLTNDSDSQN